MKASKITDTENVIFILQDEIRRTDEARYDHRLHAILLVAQGMSSRQAAQYFGDSPRTVAYWVQRFEAEGLAGLADADRPGRSKKLNQKQIDQIETALRNSPLDYRLSVNLWDGKTLSEHIKQKFGIQLGVRQCQRIFRQLGFRLRKPRSKIANSDPSQKEGFKKILKLIKNDEYDIWSLDEVHFQQYGSRCRMWILPEVKEPILLHHPTRASVGYFGAVRLRDGKFVYKSEWDKFDGETFFSFLKYLRRISSHSGRKVIIISDNARYHHAKLHKTGREKCSKKFKLMYLPPYSPGLNPIERV
jgi:transposase